MIYDQINPSCLVFCPCAQHAGTGAYGKSDNIEAKNESAESVAAKVAKSGINPSPGRWESQMKLVKMEMPGMSPELQGMMKDQMSKVPTSVSCLTKEQAEKANGEMFKQGDLSDCKYNSFSMGDGKLEADMTCKDDQGSQNMKMAGTYSSEAYTMQMTAAGNMGGQEMSMEMEVASRRVGECDGKEAS